MKEMKRISLLSVMLAVVAGLFLVSCSNDDPDGPKPSNYKSLLKWMMEPKSANVAGFSLDKHKKMVDFTMEGIGKREAYSYAYVEAITEYNDRNFTGERDSLINAYCPFSSPIESIQVYPFVIDPTHTTSSGMLKLNSESMLDEFDIVFMSYAPYLRNGYSWPEGMDGPWHRMSLREFNSKPQELVHYQFSIVPSKKVIEDAYDPMGILSVRYLFDITVKFANGKGFHWDVQFYDDGMNAPTVIY